MIFSFPSSLPSKDAPFPSGPQAEGRDSPFHIITCKNFENERKKASVDLGGGWRNPGPHFPPLELPSFIFPREKEMWVLCMLCVRTEKKRL